MKITRTRTVTQELDALCSKCAFFFPISDKTGQCREGPPGPEGFPTVTDSSWCGRFEQDQGGS